LATPASESPQLRLELRSNPLFLAAAREMIAAVAKRLGFADEVCGQMALAVDEALCNIIRHGYHRAPDRPIWVSVYPIGEGWKADGTHGGVGGGCARHGGEGAGGGGGGGGGPPTAEGASGLPTALRIVLEDEAEQVDPATIKSRDLEEVRPGGLGVHIIKSVMDEVKYERREGVGGLGGVGMRLTMIKNRTGAAGADSVKGGSCCGG